MPKSEFADRIHAVFRHALALRDRREGGAPADLELEQAAFKGLLLTDFEAQRWPAFGGLPPGKGRRPAEVFLGIRYPLVCWLDEWFCDQFPWEKWQERPLEKVLYGTGDRAWKFWEQARLAETHPTTEVLEVFFLCVMLGFRGNRRQTPETMRPWMTATQAQLTAAHGLPWQGPPELEPWTHVPRLRARERWQRLVLAVGLGLLAVVPAATFYLVRQLGQ